MYINSNIINYKFTKCIVNISLAPKNEIYFFNHNNYTKPTKRKVSRTRVRGRSTLLQGKEPDAISGSNKFHFVLI